MKAYKVLTIALATVCGAAIISTGSAFAAGGNETYYPEEVEGVRENPFEEPLEFSAEHPISDFAVDGDRLAFASGAGIFVLYNDENGERHLNDGKNNELNARSEIGKIDYADGNLYIEVKNDNTYLFPDLTTPTEFRIPVADEALYGKEVKLTTGEGYRISNDGLHYFHGVEHTNLGDGYSMIKCYGDKAYAVKENALYLFNGGSEEKIDLSYTDFSEADNILAGDAEKGLKSGSYKVEWATIKAGKYYTEIDPRRFVDGKFVQLEGGKRTRKSGGVNCLVLARSGNAVVVANDDGCYITAQSNIEPHEYTIPMNDWKLDGEGNRYAYAIADCGVYSSPYMCDLTRLTTLKQGSSHRVEITEKFTLPFIKTVYYRVKYMEGEEEITGFVASNFLTEYSFSAEDNPPEENGDKEFDYSTNVVSVVLAIVIVGLVMIAGMYLFLVCTNKGKPKKKKHEKKKKPAPVTDTDPEDYEE